MKIEAGKYYKTRDGLKVGPMEFYGRCERGYECVKFGWNLWKVSNGQNYPNEYGCSTSTSLDLIAEWPTETGPVRTVTRKEIVQGVYGHVTVGDCEVEDDGTVFVMIGIDDTPSPWKPHDLRATAATLIEIADALDGK